MTYQASPNRLGYFSLLSHGDYCYDFERIAYEINKKNRNYRLVR